MAFLFSEQNLMTAMRMHLPNVFPSVCLRWNEACSRGLPPNNWLLQSTMQCFSSENLLMKKHLWPYRCRCSNLRCSDNDLVYCFEAGTSKMLFPPGAWAHTLGNSSLACLKPSALSRKSFASFLCTGSVENTPRSMQEDRLPDSSFNILLASTHLIWSPHLGDVSWFFYEKQNMLPSFPL